MKFSEKQRGAVYAGLQSGRDLFEVFEEVLNADEEDSLPDYADAVGADYATTKVTHSPTDAEAFSETPDPAAPWNRLPGDANMAPEEDREAAKEEGSIEEPIVPGPLASYDTATNDDLVEVRSGVGSEASVVDRENVGRYPDEYEVKEIGSDPNTEGDWADTAEEQEVRNADLREERFGKSAGTVEEVAGDSDVDTSVQDEAEVLSDEDVAEVQAEDAVDSDGDTKAGYPDAEVSDSEARTGLADEAKADHKEE